VIVLHSNNNDPFSSKDNNGSIDGKADLAPTSINGAALSQKELLKIAKDMFSEPLYSLHSKANIAPLTARCKKILEKNIEEAKKLENINDIAHFIFKRYVDEQIEITLPIFYEKYPYARQLENIDSDLRKACHTRSRMYHCVAIETPIIEAIKEKFPDMDYDNLKINLGSVP
jgi:hypothetical protein